MTRRLTLSAVALLIAVLCQGCSQHWYGDDLITVYYYRCPQCKERYIKHEVGDCRCTNNEDMHRCQLERDGEGTMERWTSFHGEEMDKAVREGHIGCQSLGVRVE